MTERMQLKLCGCRCGEPHVIFFSEGDPSPRFPAYSVSAGIQGIAKLISEGLVSPDDQNRLLEDLRQTDLPDHSPEDDGNGQISMLARRLSFYSPEALERVLARRIADGRMTSGFADHIHIAISAMSEDSRIFRAVVEVTSFELEDSELLKTMLEKVHPDIREKVSVLIGKAREIFLGNKRVREAE